MASMKKESLDERLERIRKKNEELEKKHQETERDKLLAKVQGALVDCKASDDDWPKGHKYDKLDFTYDVPADKLEAEKAAKLELQQRRQLQTKPVNSRGSRFTDIPQDPKSFLADEERDDKPLEKQKSDRKPQNGEKREKKPSSQQQSPPQGGRQIIGRHKKSPKSQNHDMSPNGTDLHNTLPHQQQQQQQQQPESNVFNSDFTNLTVSVSKDGDYKSVRLSQTPMIGSGRVGPRQITKTQFQGIEPEMEKQQQQQQLQQSGFNNDMQRQGSHGNKGDRRPFNKDHQKRNGNSNNNNFRQQQQQPQKSSPQSNTHFNQAAAPTPQQQQQPSVKQFSVQDRLKRAQACNPVVGNNNNSKNLVLNIIAANEVLTEERN